MMAPIELIETQKTQAGHGSCRSEIARDQGVTVDDDVECQSAIASKD
jgi:hypothetical protein